MGMLLCCCALGFPIVAECDEDWDEPEETMMGPAPALIPEAENASGLWGVLTEGSVRALAGETSSDADMEDL
jgi:hypothetical protein